MMSRTEGHEVVSIRQRWEAYKEHLRFKYAPGVAEWALGLATFQARKRLAAGPISILLDNSVRGHGVTHETAWVSTGPKEWGDQQVETGYSARIPVHPADSEAGVYEDLCYLTGILKLVRSGHIVLRTSGELEAERFHQPAGRFTGYSFFDQSLFSGLAIESVDGYAFPDMGPSWMNLPSAEEQQRTRIANSQDELYEALVRCLGSKNSQDAWHIRTAERHGLFCFLTMDYRLVRAMEAQSNNAAVASLKTKVMTPKQLGILLQVLKVPPHVLSYTGASFPVRSDLSLPGGKRRPVKAYKRPEK